MFSRIVTALAVLSGAALTAPAQNAPPSDLSGVWQINLPAFLKGGLVPQDQPAPAKAAPRPARAPNDPPYQPWAAEKVKERRENKLKDDPEARCLMPGLPRIVNMPMPMEIIQTPQEVAILYEAFHSFRVIPTDGRGHIDKKQMASDGLYLGDSVGHWEDDTLVVDVTNFNDVTWLDNSGGIHSDALHVTERYRRPDRDTLIYQATLEDPKVFTKPWTVNWTLKLRPGERLMEYECLENNQDPPRLVGK